MQFKENKTSLVYLIIAGVILIGGGVGVWLTSKATKETEAEVKKQASAVTKMLKESKLPAPTKANVDKLKKQNQKSYEALKGLLSDISAYTFAKDGSTYPANATINDIKLENITKESFGKFVQQVYEARRGQLQELNIRVPDNFYVGMEGYESTTPISDEAARFLTYQLGAIDSILEVLTSPQVDNLELNREKGGPEIVDKVVEPKPRSNRNRGNATTSAKSKKDDAIVQTHRLRLRFKSSQDDLQNLVNYLANTKEYFFVVNSLTVVNEKQEAPTVDEVEVRLEGLRTALAAQSEEAQEGGFEVFGADEVTFGQEIDMVDEPVELNPSMEVAPEIAVQVLGDEKIQVEMEIFLITFEPQFPLSTPAN